MRRVRQAAKLAALGGGSAAFAGAVATGVVFGQVMLARHTIPRAEAPPPRCNGRYGPRRGGRPIRLAIIGDSSAAGFGVHHARETPGALLGAGLADQLGRPVQVRCLAVVGATSPTLAPQVEAAVEMRPDAAVIFIGANDVTHRVPLEVAVPHLVAAVRELRRAGARVVVGTCPDLSTVRPIQPPLRWMVRRWSRQMAAAQTVAVVEAGGATVSLGDLLGPAFAADPLRMFASDRFHPSAEGYAAAAAALLPTLLAVLGVEAQPAALLSEGEGVRALPDAAVEAVGRAGTEVRAATVAGRERGPFGRWVQLRNRVQKAIRPADPAMPGSAVTSEDNPGQVQGSIEEAA
ncbi:MAG TPA: SGNH/GDSL hydrolase family protein [Micromonosporaceae bacterium]|nr:SGNH/GDSL hydrolase family protein [Micromonosporaceae bacterium]